MNKFINIGFGNVVNLDHIVAIVSPESAPAKRMVQNAREHGHIVDATQGRKTKGILVTENETLILSALLPETLAARASLGTKDAFTREEVEHDE